MKIKNRQVIKVGNSYYFNVPQQYIKDKIIIVGKSYDMDLTEQNESD